MRGGVNTSKESNRSNCSGGYKSRTLGMDGMDGMDRMDRIGRNAQGVI